jgi:hypothetical protein
MEDIAFSSDGSVARRKVEGAAGNIMLFGQLQEFQQPGG